MPLLKLMRMCDVCFNLNLLECKCLIVRLTWFWKQVLISTYWNVNNNAACSAADSTFVLISTYWNVNSALKAVSASCYAGFNLNLLECKSKHSWTFTIFEQVLISTYWNVNFFSVACMIPISSFNLNLLECKFLRLLRKWRRHIRFNLNLLECKCGISSTGEGQDVVLISTYWNVNN